MIETEFELTVNNLQEQEFLFSHLNPEMSVLEYGSGKSTIAIAKRVKDLFSIEHDARFFRELMNKLTGNVRLYFEPPDNPNYDDDGTYEDFKSYVDRPKLLNKKFDLVFVDGRARVACCKAAVDLLKDDGVIIVHDYLHPEEKYRRYEYEVIEDFLERTGGAFAMHSFKVRK